MDNEKEIARRVLAAFELAGDRLAERGVSDAEIGRGMVAAGLSRWSRAIGPEALAEQLAGLTLATAEAAAAGQATSTPTAH